MSAKKNLHYATTFHEHCGCLELGLHFSFKKTRKHNHCTFQKKEQKKQLKTLQILKP